MNVVERLVRVVFKGVDDISGATSSASGSLDTFSKKVPVWAKAGAALAVGYQAIKSALSAVANTITSSFAAYDGLQTSQRKLEGTSKIAGLSLDDLRASAARAKEEFRLSRVVAGDLASVTALMGAKAGDASKAHDLLGAALDIGAARGMSAAETMEALNITLRGQDEGLDRLINANPSVLYKEWADAVGISWQAMDDQQKMLAIVEGLTKRGIAVGGEYVRYTESAQGQQAQFNMTLEESQARLGEALQPLRKLAIDGMLALLGETTKSTAGVDGFVASLVALGRSLGAVLGPIAKVGLFLVDSLGVSIEWVTIQIRRFAYGLTDTLGRALRLFGIDFGDALINEAQTKFFTLNEEYERFQKRVRASGERWFGEQLESAKKSGADITAAMKAASEKQVGVVEEQGAATAHAIEVNLGGPLRTVIGMTEGAIRSLGDAARDQLPPETAAKFVGHMETLAAHAREVEARLTGAAPKVEDGSRSAKSMSDGIATVARGALDAAQAFGVIDANAASALNSAVNIAGAIGQIAGGNVFAGVSGLLGGVANIVNVMVGGDRERRRIQEKNNVRLQELNDTIGNLDLNITGEDFNLAKDVLAKIIPLTGSPTDAFRNAGAVQKILADAGITFGDLGRIADELGINIKGANGSIDVALLPQLLQALGLTEFGQFGNDFASRLRSTEAGFAVNGTDAIGEISQLADVGGSFSRVLNGVFDANDITGSRARLQGLFTRLQNGELSAADFGGLTGNQFLNLLTDLIARIDDLSPNAGPSTGGGGAPTGTVVGVSAPTGDLSTGWQAPDLNTWPDFAVLLTHTEPIAPILSESLGVHRQSLECHITTVDVLRDILTAVTAGGRTASIDAIDSELEARRRDALLGRGQFPAAR